MIKYVDLSHNITNHMNVHPYDSQVKLYKDKWLNKDMYVNSILETGMHAGTHIDAPMHLINSEMYINEIPLEKFIGKGSILDVRNEDIIKYKKEYDDIVDENDIVLLYTGHDSKYETKEYYTNYPVLSKELADFLIMKKIKMIGIDLPSPDNKPFEIHKMLFVNNILIIENLTNLEKLVDIASFEVIALPLKIKAEASICRVIAKILR